MLTRIWQTDYVLVMLFSFDCKSSSPNPEYRRSTLSPGIFFHLVDRTLRDPDDRVDLTYCNLARQARCNLQGIWLDLEVY